MVVNNCQNDYKGQLDILKFILSIMILIIHSGLFPNVFFPWVRIAVPLFFIISSYLLFSKLKNLNNKNEKNKIILSYLLRNIQLYLFWFIVLLPYTIYTKVHFFNISYEDLFLNLLKGFFFSSTYPASWYIMATIIGTSIIYFLSNKLSNKMLVILTTPIICLACIRSSYMYLFSTESGFFIFCEEFDNIFAPIITSFPVSLFWIVVGKIIAENQFTIKKKFGIVILFLSCIILFLEWYFIKNGSKEFKNDCYFGLIPVSIIFFLLIYQGNYMFGLSVSCLGNLRKLSVIIYSIHIPLLTISGKLLQYTSIDPFGIWAIIIKFLFALFFGIFIGELILYFSKKKYLKFLKFAY